MLRGNWQMAGGHGPVDPDRAIKDMVAFADAGITTFDCADIYTGVEALIGRFRAVYRDRRGADALARIRVHTKYVPDLDRLGSWWNYDAPGCIEAACWLEKLREEGLIELLGVTNFDTDHVADLLAAGVPLRMPSTTYFYEGFEAFSGGIAPDAPAADRSYDAGALVALAIAEAGSLEPAAIRDAIHAVTAPDRTPIHAGPAAFEKALRLISDGQAIRYEGVIDPIGFDEYGDITGPFRLWRLVDGTVETTGQMSAEEVGEIKAGLTD